MAQIGKINRLAIKRVLDYGAQLDGGEAGNILLPKKYLPLNYQIGDDIEVFIYADNDGRLRATTQKPSVTVGQFAKLQVVAHSSAGAYMDWGLQKDLLVPKSEQHTRMEVGKSYVVYVFLDKKTERITASSKLDQFLSRQPPKYNEGDEVDLVICDQTNLGYKAVIDRAHWGVIYQNEVFKKLHIGQQLKGFIKKIRDDLKIDLSLQQSGTQGVSDIAQNILNKIKQHGGKIAVTDKSPPDDIYSLFEVSKKTFKKAIGALYKRRLISIDKDGIKILK